MRTATVALAVACAAAALYYTNGGIGAADNADPTNAADTGGNTLDFVLGAVGGIGSSPADAPTSQRQAWLDMIAISEGTYGRGDNGYNVLVGGSLFDNGYIDHPRQVIHVGGSLYSSAAGRYQIIAKTWDGVKAAIGAPDFSPAWQDAAALELTRQRGALDMVDAGDIAGAITACNKEWASFTGSPYNQNPHDMGTMLAWFQQVGGALA
jgi:muramidase (phage lysozyme)